MGSELFNIRFDENTSRNIIEKESLDYYNMKSRGYPRTKININFINQIFEDEEKANAYLEKLYDGYLINAVKYREYPKLENSSKMDALLQKIKDIKIKLTNYQKEHSCRNFKSQFIGCSKCNSKINKDYILNHYCPVCNNDLYSLTTKKTIDNYSDKIKSLSKELAVEDQKLKEKNLKFSKIKWLVQIQVHD